MECYENLQSCDFNMSYILIDKYIYIYIDMNMHILGGMKNRRVIPYGRAYFCKAKWKMGLPL